MNTYVVFNLFFTAILLLVFLGTFRLLELEKRDARTVLFAFAVASVLLSNLYWLAYDILRPGTRMPFAANEIGEWALFLLLGAAVRTQPEVAELSPEIRFTRKETSRRWKPTALRQVFSTPRRVFPLSSPVKNLRAPSSAMKTATTHLPTSISSTGKELLNTAIW